MEEPSLRKSRLALTGIAIAVVLVGGSGFLIGRGTSERQPSVQEIAPARTPIIAPTTPVNQSEDRNRALSRGDLLALTNAAADSLAAGTELPAAIGDANGRQFRIDLPFGCNGPAEAGSDAPMRWRYDEEGNTLRVSVTPVRWRADAWSAGPADNDDAETVEGYWVPRPWTASEACPPERQQTAVAGTEPVTLPGQTLALAQFFDAASARQAMRGDRPYESVTRVAPDAVRGQRGFHLRLSGRIAQTPQGTPISCRQPAGSEQRPICVVAVKINEVAIVNPSSGETLATWTVEQPSAR